MSRTYLAAVTRTLAGDLRLPLWSVIAWALRSFLWHSSSPECRSDNGDRNRAALPRSYSCPPGSGQPRSSRIGSTRLHNSIRSRTSSMPNVRWSTMLGLEPDTAVGGRHPASWSCDSHSRDPGFQKGDLLATSRSTDHSEPLLPLLRSSPCTARRTGPSTSNSSASASPIPEGCQCDTDCEANQSPVGLRCSDRVRSAFTKDVVVMSPLKDIPLPQSARGAILWKGDGSSPQTIGYRDRIHMVVGPREAI